MLKVFPAFVPFETTVGLHLPGRYTINDLKDYHQSPNSPSGYMAFPHRNISHLTFYTNMRDSFVEFPLHRFNPTMVQAIYKLGVQEESRYLLIRGMYTEDPRGQTLKEILLAVQEILSQ